MENAVVYYAISLLCLLFTLKLALHKRRRYKNLPPSPYGFPIIGHLHLMKQPFHRSLHRLSLKLGPVFSLRFGNQLTVIVTSPSAVDECFGKNDVVLANRPSLLAGKHISYNYTTLAKLPYGDQWRNLRRITTLEIFSPNRLNASLELRKAEVRRLLRKLSRGTPDIAGFVKVDVKARISELVFNIIARIVAGKVVFGDQVEIDEEARHLRDTVAEVMRVIEVSNVGEFVPLLRLFDRSFEKHLISLGKKMDKFLQGLLDQHRADKIRDTMIGHLLSLQESQPGFTDKIIKALILDMFIAGTDTTIVTLEWAMTHLVNNPTDLAKARSELDAHLGPDRLIDEPDVTNLPYLQNIISESARLNPSAPLLLPHFASEDCKVAGFDVPRGSMLLVNQWAINRDPSVWDDPETFKPERFQNGSGEDQKITSFGLGRRACPGAGLARRVVGLALGSLIQCYEWEMVGGEKVDMAEGEGATMIKLVPLEAMCKPRAIMKKVLEEGTWNSIVE